MPCFEDVLDDCLEGLLSGRLTLEECLRRYPRWAGRLAPLLRTAMALEDALGSEVSDAAKDPALRAQARRNFLNSAAARRLVAPPGAWRRWTAASLRFRVFIAQPVMSIALAFLVGFVGFSSYAVVTSREALPGDWRYPLKRTSERVRLAFAFDDDARRGLRISFAEERLEEVERLASSQRRISEPVLRDLVRTTDALGEDLTSVRQQDIERISVLAQKQQEVLPAMEPLVEPAATDDFQAALQVSGEVHEGALHALALAAAGPSAEGPPEPTPSGATTPEASATAEFGATPQPSETPGASVLAPSATPEPLAAPPGTAVTSPTPVLPSATEGPEPTPTPPAVTLLLVSLPEDQTAGLAWEQAILGDLSAAVPEDPDWVVSLIGSNPASQDPTREMLMVGHRRDGVFVAVVLLQVADGDATVMARLEGAMTRILLDDLERLLPLEAPVIHHILESVRLGPS